MEYVLLGVLVVVGIFFISRRIRSNAKKAVDGRSGGTGGQKHHR